MGANDTLGREYNDQSVLGCPGCGTSAGILGCPQHRVDVYNNKKNMALARELLCQICEMGYPVWYAPNDLWNKVVRDSEGNEQYHFLCPTCFAGLAYFEGVATMFVLTTPDRLT